MSPSDYCRFFRSYNIWLENKIVIFIYITILFSSFETSYRKYGEKFVIIIIFFIKIYEVFL